MKEKESLAIFNKKDANKRKRIWVGTLVAHGDLAPRGGFQAEGVEVAMVRGPALLVL